MYFPIVLKLGRKSLRLNNNLRNQRRRITVFNRMVDVLIRFMIVKRFFKSFDIVDQIHWMGVANVINLVGR